MCSLHCISLNYLHNIWIFKDFLKISKDQCYNKSTRIPYNKIGCKILIQIYYRKNCQQVRFKYISKGYNNIYLPSVICFKFQH